MTPRRVFARQYTDFSPEKLKEIYNKAGLKALSRTGRRILKWTIKGHYKALGYKIGLQRIKLGYREEISSSRSFIINIQNKSDVPEKLKALSVMYTVDPNKWNRSFKVRYWT